MQYLGQRNSEPNPKLLELQDVMRTWLQSVSTQPTLTKVLLLISTDCDSVRALLIGSLNEISGEGVVDAVLPTEKSWHVDGKRVLNSLRRSSWVLVCSHHLGPDFPWSAFSQVVEYESLACSPWPSICRERSIRHVTFTTVLPTSETDGIVFPTSSGDLDRIPFTLFVTEGLLDRSSLLLTLESVYNLTMIERSHSPSLKKLGKAHQYAVITVDECTAVLLQEAEELAEKRASERVVSRLIALSLQYSCCWLLLHLPSNQYSCISQAILNNLALVYSAVVLLGMKSEEFTVKVLVVSEEEDLAQWIYQIAHHTMMSSEGDPRSYLDRDWLSVVPSEEESCLVRFPCVSPLVAQTMLHRAPSLPWLLGAPLAELQQLLPEVPQKVIKLFTDTTGLYSLGPSAPRPECVPDPDPQHGPKSSPPPSEPETGKASMHDHWALTIEKSPEEAQMSCFSHNPRQDAGLLGNSSTGQTDAFFPRIENIGQTKTSSGGQSEEGWASAFQKPAGELQAACYSREPQQDGFLLGNPAGGQSDALFHRKDSYGQTGNFSAGQGDAFFDKNKEWRETDHINAGKSDAVFQRKEDWGKSGNFSAAQSDDCFEDLVQTGNSSVGKSDTFFHREENFGQTGNFSADRSDAFLDRNEVWVQTDNFGAGQSDAVFQRQEGGGTTGNFRAGRGQSDEVFPRKGNFGQTGNFSAGRSDDLFSRNEGWELTGNSSAGQRGTVFQRKEDWEKTGNFNTGQSESYFDKIEGWGHMGNSSAVQSQRDAFLQRNEDWQQTGNFSTGQSDAFFPWKENFVQTGNSGAGQSDAFLQRESWGKSGCAGLDFISDPFSPAAASTATPPAPQGFQHKQWHMEIKNHKFVPRNKIARGSTLRISQKESGSLTRETQDTSPFQNLFASGRQSSPYFQDQVPASLPGGPAHSVSSSPVSRWTGQLISEAYRLSPGANTGCSTRAEQDRKRRAGLSSLGSPASGFPQTKKGKLFYERVPGRSDGQTRLKFY
ncbi:hypothetical protein ACEWY4_011615 [Coilia grayii]|uniref:Shortage in chiasmata 1 n=1 Tax=Coilia grayii TaxID=363190 RepID=A0ABD1JY57_9TELE